MYYYITPSLYSAYYFYNSGHSSREEFLNALNKVKTPPTELMRKGIDFEVDVRRTADDLDQALEIEPDYPATRIAKIVSGGLWQQRVNGIIGKISLSGIADVIKYDTIYDIKYSESEYKEGKYQYSIQHLLYMYCTGLKKFEYLISNGKDVYKEAYNWNSDNWSDDSSETELRHKIRDFNVCVFMDEEFKEAYLRNWKKDNTCKFEIQPAV